MNWFDTSGLTSLAKSALKEAQKTIDKALDIQDESGDEQEDGPQAEPKTATSPGSSTTAPTADNADFFSSWGLTVSAESPKDEPIKEQPVVTESPSKATSQSMWGSFAGSFFEQPNKTADNAIVRPPKAKSMNVISDGKYDSQDDLFSKSQLVMTDGEGFEYKNSKSMDSPRSGDRRGSSKSNRLSLVSSRNSSDSVEVLSQSMKTTPDSEVSAQSISHSSSVGQKMNSESVEILPDSLVSPSSIECLGFDSYSSEKNSSSSSILSPDLSDKKLTPIGDRTERAETADSVSLVADDDEDTMSYNSVSECTAPTVLDTEDKSVSPNPKGVRTDAPRKQIDKEFIHIEHTIIPQKMQVSENSSNDGSWSDRTLNADNDSVILDTTTEEQKKELDQEDMLMEKLSDSSSFYNVKVSTDMLRSDSSAFVNIEKLHGSAPESCSSSQKDGSVKERTSPISSDSKSDLVKIGSDRTSGHTSGDDLETATSSDIEIIPSPNGDNGHSFCRSSPAKYAFKQSKFDGTTSPNLVDLVLGKSLATKIRGHNRELSEASIQSNTSDESQGSENDRLMKRLCEMAEILEARENRLMEVSRSNAELAESNTDLKSQLESLLAKHEMGDVHVITEDYTQRLSALEKKFQQAIREKDQLRKQLDAMKSESSSRKNSSEMENVIKEKDEVIMQLQEEGEKLARQQLQHSNIIKKLRAKEKDNEQVIKGLRDKIAEQTSEMDRVKRAIAAKEELEVNQIEAVYRLTTANKKMETELFETKSALDDTSQRLESARTSLDAARAEVTELQRTTAELKRRRGAAARAETERDEAVARAERATAELQQLRADMVQGEWDAWPCGAARAETERDEAVARAERATAELQQLRADMVQGEWDAWPCGAARAETERDEAVARAERATAELQQLRADMVQGEWDAWPCGAARAETERDEAVARAERATAELQQLRADMVQGEWDAWPCGAARAETERDEAVARAERATAELQQLRADMVQGEWDAWPCGAARAETERDEAVARAERATAELQQLRADMVQGEWDAWPCGAARAETERDEAVARAERATAELQQLRADMVQGEWDAWPCGAARAETERDEAVARAERATAELQQLRADMVQGEWDAWPCGAARAETERDEAVARAERATAELQQLRADMVQGEWDAWPCGAARAETERDEAVARAERATAELQQLRADMVQEEQRWITRLESIRRELSSCQQHCAALESQGGGGWGAGAEAEAASALLVQLAALQRAAVDRDQAHAAVTRTLATQRAEAEASLAKALERERLSRSDAEAARDAAATAEALLRDTQHNLDLSETQRRDTVEALQRAEERLQNTTQALERLKADHKTTIEELTAEASETEELLAAERNALDTERRRNAILQEQMSSRGDVSPHSAASDTFSGSLWPQDEGTVTPVPTTAFGVEEALSTLTRRAGEARALAAAHAQLLAERDALRTHLAAIQAELDELRTVQEQYDALLQMYGEKEEQLEEVKLDLQDVTALYKAQLDELIALKRAQR